MNDARGAEVRVRDLWKVFGLPANANASDACAPFVALNECLASLHASHNIGVDFNCLRAKVTGVQTNADLSGCKGSIGDKTQSLHKAIHEFATGLDRHITDTAKSTNEEAEESAISLSITATNCWEAVRRGWHLLPG